MKRTKAHKTARIAAEQVEMSLDRLTNKALLGELFINPSTKESYSVSWVKSRLKENDMRVAEKLSNYAKNLS